MPKINPAPYFVTSCEASDIVRSIALRTNLHQADRPGRFGYLITRFLIRPDTGKFCSENLSFSILTNLFIMNTKPLTVIAFAISAVFFSFNTTTDERGSYDKRSTTTRDAHMAADINALSNSLTFHTSFNNGADAEFGKGDKKIYSGDFKGSREQNEIPTTAGLGNPPLVIAKGKGKYGDALSFTKENSHVVFYKLDKNIQYSEKDFKGTLSLWMSLDPSEIPDQYCDPIQITDKYYASDAIWLDITKNDVPPDMRLGVLGDERVWDVNKRQGAAEEFFWHLLKISNPPFEKGKWTHVAITWELNGSDIGRAKLYFNGEYAGQSGPIGEPFIWDTSKVTMRLGTGNYLGMIDDIAIFNTSLSASEIKSLHSLENGVAELHRK